MWNIFDSSQNSQSLIDFVRGAEVSNKSADLLSLNGIFRAETKIFDPLPILKSAYPHEVLSDPGFVHWETVRHSYFLQFPAYLGPAIRALALPGIWSGVPNPNEVSDCFKFQDLLAISSK